MDNIIKSYPVGTVRDRKDGKYKKVSEGKWEKISEGKEDSTKEENANKKSYDRKYENFSNDKDYNEATKKYLDRVSDESLTSLSNYVQDSFSINGQLRTGKDIGKSKEIEKLDNAFKEAFEEGDEENRIRRYEVSTIYRGAVLDKSLIEKLQSDKNSGKSGIFKDEGFVSTSMNKDIAEEFLDSVYLEEDQVPVFMKIDVYARGIEGLPISNLNSSFGDQDEILLNRGTRFRVSEIVKRSDGTYEIELSPLFKGDAG